MSLKEVARRLHRILIRIEEDIDRGGRFSGQRIQDLQDLLDDVEYEIEREEKHNG